MNEENDWAHNLERNAMKLHEHGMKVLERVLEVNFHGIVTVNEMSFGIMSGTGTIDAVFMWRKLQKEYRDKGKLYMCFVDIEKAFDKVPRNVFEWAMMKKSISEVLVRSVMSLYEGAKTRVRGDSELSEEFKGKMWMHQGSVMSPFLLSVLADVVTETSTKILRHIFLDLIRRAGKPHPENQFLSPLPYRA